MKRLALVGFAPNTLRFLRHSKADEVWSIVWAYQYPEITRMDRLFEIHSELSLAANDKRPAYKKARDHWSWMKANRNLPIYMQDVHPDIPMSVRYPIEDVSQDIFGCSFDDLDENAKTNGHYRWTRAGIPARLFTSTVDYMFALAIQEAKWDVIEIYGIELSSDSEYIYQRDGYGFYHGFAMGRGIKIEQQDTTKLLYKPKRYGYDGYQMISRQSLESLKRKRNEQLEVASAELAYLEGKLGAVLEAIVAYEETNAGLNGNAPDTNLYDMREKFTHEVMEKRNEVMRVTGALENVNYLIREIDLDEEFLPIPSRITTVDGV